MPVRDVMEKLAKCDPYQEVVINVSTKIEYEANGESRTRLVHGDVQIDAIRPRGNEVIIETFQ